MPSTHALVTPIALAVLLAAAATGCPEKNTQPAPSAQGREQKQAQAKPPATPAKGHPDAPEAPALSDPKDDPFGLDKQIEPTLPADRWVRVELDQAGASALFPAKPRSKEQSLDGPAGTTRTKVYLTLIPDQAAAFSLGVTDMPASIAAQISPEDECDKTRDKLMESMHSQVRMGQRQEAYQGRPGCRFSFIGAGPSGNTYIRVRLIRDGHRTYQLMAAHVAGRDVPMDAEYFTRGLQLPAKKTETPTKSNN